MLTLHTSLILLDNALKNGFIKNKEDKRSFCERRGPKSNTHIADVFRRYNNFLKRCL